MDIKQYTICSNQVFEKIVDELNQIFTITARIYPHEIPDLIRSITSLDNLSYGEGEHNNLTGVGSGKMYEKIAQSIINKFKINNLLTPTNMNEVIETLKIDEDFTINGKAYKGLPPFKEATWEDISKACNDPNFILTNWVTIGDEKLFKCKPQNSNESKIYFLETELVLKATVIGIGQDDMQSHSITFQISTTDNKDIEIYNMIPYGYDQQEKNYLDQIYTLYEGIYKNFDFLDLYTNKSFKNHFQVIPRTGSSFSRRITYNSLNQPSYEIIRKQKQYSTHTFPLKQNNITNYPLYKKEALDNSDRQYPYYNQNIYSLADESYILGEEYYNEFLINNKYNLSLYFNVEAENQKSLSGDSMSNTSKESRLKKLWGYPYSDLTFIDDKFVQKHPQINVPTQNIILSNSESWKIRPVFCFK